MRTHLRSPGSSADSVARIRETARPRILIVGDDAAVAEVIGLYLGSEYEVQTAPNSAVALQRFERHRPDLVILDLRLGAGVDGLDVFHEMRKRLSKAPTAILLSGSDAADLAARALRVPVLRKPILRRALVNMVRRVLDDAGQSPMWVDVVTPGAFVSASIEGATRRGTVFEVRDGLVYFRDASGTVFTAPRDRVFIGRSSD